MQITDIRAEKISGIVEEPIGFEERLLMPLDVYDEFQTREFAETKPKEILPHEVDGERRLELTFLFVETDTGHQGIFGPLDRPQTGLALRLRDLLVGRDPLATEKLWDLMYRSEVHGRKGKTMQAISALDCALWDLKGKYYDEPLYRLLGGPTREEIPAYASMLGFSVEPEDVHERASEFKERGYEAQKWFFRHGPGSGKEGIKQNVALIEAARDAVGENYDLMFDCWMGWDRTYALEMIDRLEEFRPRWVEEPLQPDRMEQLAEVAQEAPFPIAGGEHEYTRWGIHEMLRRDALDVVQTDTYWAGGVSEMQHIFTLGSVHDVPVIPHGGSVPVNVHLSAAQPPSVTPMIEYLVLWNESKQYFFQDPHVPEDGSVTVDDRPGLGIELDESKIDERTEYEIEW